MLTEDKLYKISKSRFAEAKILRDSDMSDGAIYLCGYALELILKRHIVKRLQWDGYPEGQDFKKFQTYKTHDLDILLKLAGLEKFINSDIERLADWQIAKGWNSEIRYNDIGSTTPEDCKKIIESIRKTLNLVYNLN